MDEKLLAERKALIDRLKAIDEQLIKKVTMLFSKCHIQYMKFVLSIPKFSGVM